MSLHKSYRHGALARSLLLLFLGFEFGLGAALESGCNSAETASGDGGADNARDARGTFDLCDTFTAVGASCPAASPVRCFPMCDAGGCSCRATPKGPQWACVTDLSCLPPCAPIDDACASTTE